MAMKRNHYVIYAVVLREHKDVIKIGRTTKWQSRRREYDNWNFANGDGLHDGIVYFITDEYVDLSAVEKACIDGLASFCARHSGNEWFRGEIEDAMKVVEDVLSSADISYITSSAVKTGAKNA